MSEQHRWGVRAIASLIVFVIAIVMTPVAIVGHWGHRTVIDAEAYIATVGPLIEQPEVQQAVAEAMSTAIIDQVDTQQFVTGALGKVLGDSPFASLLGAPITAGVNNLITDLTKQLVQSDQFEQVWIKTNTLAQHSLVSLLDGNPEGIVQTQGDQVVLDISSLLTAMQQQLVDRGFTVAAKVTIPQTDRVIVLATVPWLPQVQFIYKLSSPILQWLPLFLAALFGLAIILSRNRTRTVLATGVGLIVMSGITLIGLNVVESSFVDHLQGTVFAQASSVFWTTLVRYLMQGLEAVVVLGLIIAVAGWFAGRSGLATSWRSALSNALHDLGGGLPEGLRRSVRAYTPVLRWASVIAMLLCLVFQPQISIFDVTWISLVTIALFAVIEILSGPERFDVIETVVIVEETTE